MIQKLNYLAEKFDSVCEEDLPPSNLEDLFIAQPSVRRTSKLFPGGGSGGRFVIKAETDEKTVEEVREALSGMDRRLAFHINIVSESMGKMVDMVEEVHEAVIDNEGEAVEGIFRRTRSQNKNQQRRHTNNGTSPAKKKAKSKFDKLLAAIYPMNGVIFEVNEKLNGFRGLMGKTRNQVERLLPRTDELLLQNDRQEKALAILHRELRETTDSLIKELDQVSKYTCKLP